MMEHITSISEGVEPDKMYIEVGELKNETIETIIAKTKEMYSEFGSKREIVSSACGSLLATEIIKLNLDALENPEKIKKLPKDISKIEDEIRKIHILTGYAWEPIKVGFFAEAAVAVALKVRGFKVFMPDHEDDTKGKIDLLAYDPDEKKIIPIQVKSSSYLKGVVLSQINDDNNTIFQKIGCNWDNQEKSYDSKIIDHSYNKLNDLTSKLKGSLKNMLEYLSPLLKSDNVKTFPILIAIPGGEYCEEPMFDMRTALPKGAEQPFTKGSLPDIIYEKLEKIIYSTVEGEKGEKC